jgi:LacI family transcriptional regulator
MSKTRKTVLLALAWHLERLMQGVVDYAKVHDWHLVIHRGGDFKKVLYRWRGEGIITSFWNAYTEEDTERILTARNMKTTKLISLVPVKNSCDSCRIVREDDYAIGKLAADYFVNCGHRNFAAYSDSLRMIGFCDQLYSRDINFHCYAPNRSGEDESQLTDWLRALPKPCAIFCENDWDAAELINTAIWAKLTIPDELAILGVGNDALICQATPISLSSIDSRLYELGKTAAAELDEFIDGKESPENVLLLKPNSLVVERQSTHFYAVENPVLRKMINYFRKNATSHVSITDVARKFHISESAFYKLFVRNLEISPKQFLLEQRLRIACDFLLNNSACTMDEIAWQSGFPTACAMFSAFQKRFGTSPGNWRKNNINTSTFNFNGDKQ